MKEKYIWFSQYLKEEIDKAVKKRIVKEYFTLKFNEREAEKMFELGLYIIPAKDGLAVAIPEIKEQEKLLKKYGGKDELIKVSDNLFKEILEKYSGWKQGQPVQESSMIAYNIGIEEITAHIINSIKTGKDFDKEKINYTLKPLVELAGMYSKMRAASLSK